MTVPRCMAAAALALSCASVPALPPRAECPAPGARPAPRSAVAAPGDARRGAAAFARRCAGCHASAPEQREPDAAANAPRLDCADWLDATSDGYLYDAINRGPGQYGHGDRPPLGEQLPPGEIADLVAYLRDLARAAPPVNPAGSEPTTRR
jgi:mono/diheme cytochrome c family protein